MQVEERWFPPHRLCREALETASQPDPVLSQASQPSPLRPLAWGALPPAPVPVAPGRVSRCSVHRVCMVAPLIPSLLVLAPSSVTFAQRTRNLSRRDIRNLVVKKCLWKMEVQKPIMHHVTFLHHFFFPQLLSCWTWLRFDVLFFEVLLVPCACRQRCQWLHVSLCRSED